MNNGEDVGFIRSLVDEDLDGFRQKFESFLDRCQPFPSYVGMGRFLSVFFSSVFITARFAGIINKNERVYVRFDNHDVVPGNADLEIGQRKTGNLKVAVLTDQLKGEKRIVRYYTISDRWNSEGSRFSEIEKAAVERRIVGQNQGLEGNLDSEEYKISVQGYASTQGERGAITVQNLTGDGFTGYSASEFAYYRRELGMHLTTNEIREGIARNLQLPGRNIAREYFENNINFTEFAAPDEIINNPIENLANADVDAVSQQYIDIILDRATQFYNQHREISGFNISGAKREFEDRGFWLGVLATFSYHYTVDIDLSPANSCVTFLVRCQAERRNVPIVVNFATGGGDGALSRAKDYAKGLHSSSYISIHTESEHAVCVGLNLNQATFSVDTVEFLKNRLHFVEKLFKRVQDRQNGEIQEETRNFLLHHLPREIPIDEGNLNRRFDYMTGFTFGSSAFDIRPVQLEEGDEAYVTRCILRYGNENLRRSVLTIVFHAQGSDIVILHIRASNDIQLGAITLPQGHIAAVGVVTYTLNDRSGINSNAVRFNTPGDYLLGNGGNLLGGQLIEISNAENVHGILEGVMNDGWQDRGQHGELFKAISRVLMPMNGNAIIDVNSWDKFLSILHSVFYTCENPDKVLSRYKAGQTHSIQREGREVRTRVTEQRLDLLLLRRTEENDSDTHPIGYVLGFADNAEEVEQEQDEARYKVTEFMDKQRGYLPITSGNEVVLSYTVFNGGAQRAEELITIPENLYIHRLNRHDALRRVEPQQPVRLVEPEGVIDESPPANLLSDVTIQNLRNYRQNVGQEDQRKEKILFFQQGDNDNQCIEVRLHECSKENAIRKRIRSIAHGTIPTTQTVQDVLTQIRGILNNQQIEVSDLLTLEFATSTGYYDYWLQQIDIARAGRLQYQLHTEGNHAFEVVNLARDNQQMTDTLNQFEENAEHQRLTLIITLNNTHWVTLAIERENGNYIGYYANSSGGNVPNNVTGIVRNNLGNNVRIENVSVYQQTDSHNCGLWALENARDINQVLNQNPGRRIQNITDAIKEQLRRDDQNRNENYFRGLRRNIAQLFRDNPQDNVQLQAYHDNKGRIDPLLRTYLELGYHRVGGGYGLGEAPISLSVSDFSDLPQSSLESPEASHVSNLSKGKVGR